MPVYTVHMSEKIGADENAALQKIELVRDGFRIPALIFSIFWLLWHRLWLVSLIVIATYTIFFSLIYYFQLHPLSVLLIESLIGFFLALEGSSLHRWTLARQNMPVCDVVIADNETDAEAKAIVRWLERHSHADHTHRKNESAKSDYAHHINTQGGMQNSVIGLFPQSEMR